MDLKSKPVAGTFWHGVGRPEGWAALLRGESLRLPELGQHAHDPGDYGLAVYLTNQRGRARNYAGRYEGLLAMVRVEVELTNAISLDWRTGRALDPKHPCNQVIDLFTRRWGCPIQGTPERRHEAARRWRAGLIERGYDGWVVERAEGETELALYYPDTAIKVMYLDPDLAEAR